MFKVSIILFFFLIAGWILFTFKLTEVPPGINGDEAAIGLNAIHISKDGYDLRGNFLPVFTSLPDSQDWKQPITVYSEVLAFKIFGPSYFTLRAVSIFYVLLSALLLFYLIRMLMGNFLAGLGILIFLTTPIIMIQSHLAMENVTPLPFIILWLIGVCKYTQQRKERYLIGMAVCLILAFYSYLGMRLIMPVLSLLSVVLILFVNGKKKLRTLLRQEAVFIALFIPFAISLLFFKSQYPGSLWGLYRPYVVESYQNFFLPYLSNFDPTFLYIFGDTTPYHSTGKFGMFLIATLPLFILGFIKVIRLNQLLPNFVTITFFLAPVLFGFGSTVHRASRIVVLVPLYVVICCFGLLLIVNLKRGILKIAAVTMLLTLILLNYLDFIKDYWFDYPNRVKSDFAKPIHLGFEKLSEQSKQDNLIPLVQSDLHLQNQTAFSFFEASFFQQPLKKWSISEKIPPNSAVLIEKGYIEGKLTKNIQTQNINGSDFLILNNNNQR